MSKKSFKTGFDSLLGDKETPTKHHIHSVETRSTFIIKTYHLEKLKSIAYFERKMLKEVLSEALANYIDKYEASNGSLHTPK